MLAKPPSDAPYCPFCGKAPDDSEGDSITCLTPSCPISNISIDWHDWRRRSETSLERAAWALVESTFMAEDRPSVNIRIRDRQLDNLASQLEALRRGRAGRRRS